MKLPISENWKPPQPVLPHLWEIFFQYTYKKLGFHYGNLDMLIFRQENFPILHPHMKTRQPVLPYVFMNAHDRLLSPTVKDFSFYYVLSYKRSIL